MLNKDQMHGYQDVAVEHIKNNDFCGLFLDMGLGKTVSTLTAIDYLMYQDFEISKVLVVAPKRVAESVWDAEIKNWSHLKHLKLVKIAGTERQRRGALMEKADIYTLGRDNVAWLCGMFGGSKLPFDMLIIDESSSFKNPKSIRFKALRQVQPSLNRIVLLTGTPAPNGLIDLWAQLYLLDRGERLGRFVTRYREEYFKPNQRNGHIVYNYKLKKESEKRIHAKIGDICMSMKSEDYLDLPGSVINDILIYFPENVQKLYDEFEKEQILETFGEGQEITAINAAALSNKLLQFANGAVYDVNKDYHEVHNLKLQTVKDIIEDAAGKPVLIAWAYRHDKERLHKFLKKYNPRDLKTNEDIEDWNKGKIEVMMMHPASGGHGLNLQSGGHIIVWFGQTWSLELYQQFNKRLDRQGQGEVVIINRLIASKTIDQDVIKKLAGKAAGQEGLMQAIKAKIRKYIKS